MSPQAYDPNWKPQEEGGPRTDLASLLAAPVPMAEPGEPIATDFQSLKRDGFFPSPQRVVHMSMTDYLIDVLTPFMIFVMVYSVIFFLLDARYVYTSVHDMNLRVVTFCFIMGVVALNRLIARDGSNESILYFILLAGAIGMYTLATTSAYEVGAVAKNFLTDPWMATFFNMTVVVFLWWAVNRLVHECCVDENKVAGDVGMITSAAKRLEGLLRRSAEAEKKPRPRKEPLLYNTLELEAYDPLDGYQPPEDLEHKPEKLSLAERLPRRHPGVSILVFSIPVMIVFSLGLPVVRHGGPSWVRAGQFYMGVYTATALFLLMLTSLGGLRQYFRNRGVRMPSNVGWFWVGLGTSMIAIIMVAAAQLPKPALPPLAYVSEHEVDAWARGADTFELSPFSATPVEILERSQFMDRVGMAVWIILGLFFAYGGLRAVEWTAHEIATHPHWYPAFIVRAFALLSRAIQRLLRLPRLPSFRPARRIERGTATSASFRNSMGDAAIADQMGAADHVEYAYAALCALAKDMGVPRNAGQTPYEFINAFPHELRGLKEEAQELTRLYVLAAYSPLQVDERVLDRLRKFWATYERIRARVMR